MYNYNYRTDDNIYTIQILSKELYVCVAYQYNTDCKYKTSV